ncbi:MAG: hypothetical protein HYR55_05635 [Acidobacteria bacterium]|nr:hypothetical protein [Acidobacteriota bacterium]MBI3656500.1 hypothetical protein [Acidobacteriota bacterium]
MARESNVPQGEEFIKFGDGSQAKSTKTGNSRVEFVFLLAKYFLELPFRPLLMRVFHDFEAPPTFEIFASLVPARSGWE